MRGWFVMLGLIISTFSWCAQESQKITLPNGKHYEIVFAGPFVAEADQTSGFLLAFKSDLLNKNQTKASCIELIQAMSNDLKDSDIDVVIVRGQHSGVNESGLKQTVFEGHQFQRHEDRWILTPSDNLPMTYSNRLLGFSVEKPDSWWYHWVTEEEPDDTEFSGQRAQELQAISVLGNHLSITQKKEPVKGLNPTLNISVISATISPEHYVQSILRQMGQPKISQNESVTFKGLSGHTMTAEFTTQYGNEAVNMWTRFTAVTDSQRIYVLSAFYLVQIENRDQVERDVSSFFDSFRTIDSNDIE